jgi:hypothetical protein
MVAVARHIDNVPESRTYYDKKVDRLHANVAGG